MIIKENDITTALSLAAVTANEPALFEQSKQLTLALNDFLQDKSEEECHTLGVVVLALFMEILAVVTVIHGEAKNSKFTNIVS